LWLGFATDARKILTSHEEMDRFCSEYVSLFSLAEERGKDFGRVVKDLNSYGINPACDLKKIGARF
jgi:hypothetical protein